MKKIAWILLFSLITSAVFSQDWSDCEYNLERVARRARDAASQAADLANLLTDLESKKSDLEDAKEDYLNCINFPRTYDTYRDNCYSKKSDYESVLDEYNNVVNAYNSALSDLKSQFDEIRKYLRYIESETGYDF